MFGLEIGLLLLGLVVGLGIWLVRLAFLISICESANGFQFNMLGPKARWSLVSIPGLAKGTL